MLHSFRTLLASLWIILMFPFNFQFSQNTIAQADFHLLPDTHKISSVSENCQLSPELVHEENIHLVLVMGTKIFSASPSHMQSFFLKSHGPLPVSQVDFWISEPTFYLRQTHYSDWGNGKRIFIILLTKLFLYASLQPSS